MPWRLWQGTSGSNCFSQYWSTCFGSRVTISFRGLSPYIPAVYGTIASLEKAVLTSENYFEGHLDFSTRTLSIQEKTRSGVHTAIDQSRIMHHPSERTTRL